MIEKKEEKKTGQMSAIFNYRVKYTSTAEGL